MKYLDRIALPQELQPGRRRDLVDAQNTWRWLTVAKRWDETMHQWLPTGQQRIDPNRKARKRSAAQRKAARRAYANKWNPFRKPMASPEIRAWVRARREAAKETS